jgi:hypothetical protein
MGLFHAALLDSALVQYCTGIMLCAQRYHTSEIEQVPTPFQQIYLFIYRTEIKPGKHSGTLPGYTNFRTRLAIKVLREGDSELKHPLLAKGRAATRQQALARGGNFSSEFGVVRRLCLIRLLYRTVPV